MRGVLMAVVAGCGGGGTAGQVDALAAVDARQGDPSLRVGRFEIELTNDGGVGLTRVAGSVSDLPAPETVGWTRMLQIGECALEVPSVPFCEVPCTSAEGCVVGGVCQAYGVRLDVGEVGVTGLALAGGGDTFSMTALNGTYQPLAGTSFANPPFAVDGLISVEGAGGAGVAAFAVTGVGIAPISLGNDPLVLEDGVDAILVWAAGSSASRVRTRLDISHHGGTRGQIVCDGEDDGSTVIDGELVGGLLALGVAGFPSIVVTRYTLGSTVIAPGRLDLEVVSPVEQPVTVPGLESCFTDDDCQAPSTCQDDLTCS